MERLIISGDPTGLETDVKPFLLNNGAFPRLVNAYAWRKQVLRKRGTNLLGRLRRDIDSFVAGNYSTVNGTNTFLIFTRLGVNVAEPDAAIIPGTLELVFGAAISQTLTDVSSNGTLTITGAGPITAAVINYNTGVISITANSVVGPSTSTLTVSYYPVLPVMGLEDFEIGTIAQPLMISFDTRYSYGFEQGLNQFYDVNFHKTTGTPFVWNGEDYQQFWTENYLGITTIESATPSGCLWTTNGDPGFHFLNGTYSAGTGTAVITFVFTSGGAPFQNLAVGDVLWFNEWGTGGSTINGLNGTVTTIVNSATGTYQVTFIGVQTVAGTGITQMMTNSISGQDGIRWYDGDPEGGAAPHTLGWVNFAPPLSAYNASTNPLPLYLVGAKLITVFKNRLEFWGVYLRTSASVPGAQYYPNRVVYSQVGTPYYSLPMPFNLTGFLPQVEAWYQNVAGRGGFLTAPIDEEIVTVSQNKDLLICGFEFQKLKLIATGDDNLPFIFQTINSELGTNATFSGVTLDTGDLTIGSYGIVLTTSTSCQRIDLQIPDSVFSIATKENKNKRVTAIRDYEKEFVYFTYCPFRRSNTKFPNQTLLYNYRENTWAIFEENFTTYGTFRRTADRTWASIGQIYRTWEDWTDPWEFGGTSAFFPLIVGGNQHGFVLEKGLGVEEDNAEIITAMSGTIMTSPDHGLESGDYIEISGAIGSTNLNGTIQQITVQSPDTFTVNTPATGTYLGGAVYKRFSIPFIQTKQFPPFWQNGNGVRIGTQRFLFDKTTSGEVTIDIYTSQNSASPANDPAVYPYLPYTNVVPTYPEDNQYDGDGQAQIWHRSSNSFSGDTVQIGITLRDSQIRDPDVNEADIVLHAIAIDLYPGRTLAL